MKVGYNKLYLYSTLLTALLMLNSACTRDKESNLSLKLSIPSGSAGFSSLTAPNATLSTVIVNVRIPGKPLFVKEVDYHDTTGPAFGAPITIEIPNVPSGSDALVQYLGLFEAVSGNMILTYGDSVVNISGTQTTANVVATVFGNSNKQGRVSGRFITSGSSSYTTFAGPTGILTGYIMPPNNRPRMAVTRTPIVNGWFNIFALEGTTALMTYELPDGTPVFVNKNLDYFVTSNPSEHKKIVMHKPVTYRRDHKDGVLKADGAEDYVLGVFAKDSAVFSNISSGLSGVSLCYANFDESIPNVFTDATGLTQVNYKSSSGTLGTDIIKNASAGTGNPSASNTLYVSGCNPNTHSLSFFHNMIGGGGEDVTGIRPPFRMIDSWKKYGGFLNQSFTTGPDTIHLLWQYLPGVSSSDVSGAIVFAKSNSASGGGGGGDKNCFEKATSEGMTMATSVTGIVNTANLSMVLGTAVDSNNYYNFQFMICPYRELVAGGPREYFEEIRSGCYGDCNGGLDHFGWALSGATTSISTNTAYPNNVMASVANITLEALNGHQYTILDLAADAAGLSTGDEIMIRVSAVDKDVYACGTSISPQQYAFARVLYKNSTLVYIPQGTFLDKVDITNLTTAPPTASHCFIQVAKVLQYGNLTFTSTGAMYTNQYAGFTNAGGVLPMRVSGTLTFTNAANSILAGGTGYGANLSGGNGRGSFIGHGGQEGISTPYGSSGGAGLSSAGGAGNAATASPFVGSTGMIPLAMGASGGGSSTATGGSGGGLIFIAGRKIVNTASSNGMMISANGDNGNGSGGKAGGGGAGGSVAIVAEKFVPSTYPIDLSANGGGGGAASGAYGGGGGGGNLSILVCDQSNISSMFAATNAYGGASGGGAANAGGLGNTVNLTPQNYSLCRVGN